MGETKKKTHFMIISSYFCVNNGTGTELRARPTQRTHTGRRVENSNLKIRNDRYRSFECVFAVECLSTVVLSGAFLSLSQVSWTRKLIE